MFLRLNLGLEAHIIVMKTKQWRMILNGGTVPGNNVDPKKALLLRSFLVPKAFNNEFSRRSDQQRLINVFAAWEFCHKDGDTVLLVDWSRIVKMHLSLSIFISRGFLVTWTSGKIGLLDFPCFNGML